MCTIQPQRTAASNSAKRNAGKEVPPVLLEVSVPLWQWYSRDLKTNTKILQIGNILPFLTVLVVNTLASTVGINSRLTGTISDRIPNLFVP
jgi:hypothetical protein